MRVADIMTHKVATVSPTTTVSDIVKVLLRHRISAVPVVDAQDLLVGMVSEADLMHRREADTELRRPWWLDLISDADARAASFLKLHGRTAADVMTHEVAVADEDAPIAAVARIMDERRVKRLPVLRDGKVVGIVARSDLIRCLAMQSPQEETTALDDHAIKAQFEKTVRAAGLGTVTAVVEQGVVHLWGIADSARARQALELAAREIPGVRRVDNRLTVHVPLPVTL